MIVVGGRSAPPAEHTLYTTQLDDLAAEHDGTSAAGPYATCFLMFDHLGSTRLVTDQTAN